MADGVPPIPDRRSRQRHHPDSVERHARSRFPTSSTAATSSRGTPRCRRSCKWGFVGEAAYVGTRQIDQLGFLELNWSPIGGGQAGRQLNQQFGRTAQTRLVAPIGDTKYDALQARLDRRFANGFQIGVGYTLSKSTGIAGAPRQRRHRRASDSGVLPSEPRAQPVRSHAQPADHEPHRAAVRAGPALAERRRRARGDRRRLAGQQHPELHQRDAVRHHRVSGTSLNAPESAQRADQVKSDVEILGGIGRGNAYFDPLAFKPVTEARFGTAPWSAVRGPGYANWDLGVFRQLELPRNTEPADPVRSVQRAQHGALQQPGRQRLEPAAQPRRDRPQSERVLRGHERVRRAAAARRRSSGLVVTTRAGRRQRRSALFKVDRSA